MFLVLEKIKYTVLYIVLFLTLEVDVSVELPILLALGPCNKLPSCCLVSVGFLLGVEMHVVAVLVFCVCSNVNVHCSLGDL